uniref:BHLH2 n=1 Tax=Lonicera caerulea TaxID=134520 RepID=A0A9E9GEC6_9DIPS|nr:bHLH2 [Lonicera caerulea]
MAQQGRNEASKIGSLEIKEDRSSRSRSNGTTTLQELFNRSTRQRSNNSEEVSSSPLRIPPGHSTSSPTLELYRTAMRQRRSRLRYINPKGELDYYIPTKADLESPRRLELLCDRIREIDLISESPHLTGGEIRRASNSFSEPKLLQELAQLRAPDQKRKSGILFCLKRWICFPWGRVQADKAGKKTKSSRKRGGKIEEALPDMEISSPMMPEDERSTDLCNRISTRHSSDLTLYPSSTESSPSDSHECWKGIPKVCLGKGKID